MLITVRENTSVAIRCPICLDAVSRDNDKGCDDCHTHWHAECDADGCPTCLPTAQIRLMIEDRLDTDHEVAVNDQTYSPIRACDGTYYFPLDDIPLLIHVLRSQELDEDRLMEEMLETAVQNGDLLAQGARGCADLQELYDLEQDLEIDVIPSTGELEEKLTEGFEIRFKDGVVEVDDSQCVWWGDSSDWDRALAEASFRLAKAIVADSVAGPEADYRVETQAEEYLQGWYDRACVRTCQYYTTFDQSLTGTDIPAVALELMLSKGGMEGDVRDYLKGNRGDPSYQEIRDKLAVTLRKRRN